MRGMIEATKKYHFQLEDNEMQGLAKDIEALVTATKNLPEVYVLSKASVLVLDMANSTTFNQELYS